MAEEITDAGGRRIKLRVVDPSFALMLAEAAGDASANVGFMRLAGLYLLVDEIDGIPVPFPQDKDQLYAIARQLGNDGVAALSAYMSGKPAGQEAQQAKKLSRHPALRDALFLAQSGVPFQVVMRLPLWKVRAYCVAAREMQGERYDWDHGCWEAADG